MKFKTSSPNNTPSMFLYGIQCEQMLSDKLINQLISTKLHKYIVYGKALPYVTPDGPYEALRIQGGGYEQ